MKKDMLTLKECMILFVLTLLSTFMLGCVLADEDSICLSGYGICLLVVSCYIIYKYIIRWKR